MKFINIVLLSSAAFVSAEALFFGGGTLAITGGPALAGIIALKAAALGGLALGAAFGGRRRRFGRSVEETRELLLIANRDDAADCAKKLICELSAFNAEKLTEKSKSLLELLSERSTVEFDLAHEIGRKIGKCREIYSRCPYSAKQLTDVLEDQF